jgi:hypothetical protein
MNISNSPDISALLFQALFDISTATPSIVLTNQSTGNNLAGCTWWYDVKTPSGTYIHEGDQAAPDRTGVWTTITVPDAWPQPFGQVEFSKSNPYSVTLYVKDSTGTVYSLMLDQRICKPTGNAVSIGNFGQATVSMLSKCQTAQLYVQDNTNYMYVGNSGLMVAKNFTVDYPLDSTGSRPSPFTLSDFANALVPTPISSPGYTLYVNSTYEYPFSSGITVKVKYLLSKEFSVNCGIDLCPLVCEYEKLIHEVESGQCSNGNYQEKKDLLAVITPKMALALIALQQPACGIDLPALICEIKKLGSFDCDCFPGNGNNTQLNISSDFNFQVNSTCGDITGNFAQTGNNITLDLADKSYIFNICQGIPTQAFTITPSTNGCTKTFCLNVDLDVLRTDLGNVTGSTTIFLNVYDHNAGASTPPANCPNSFYPAYIYDYTNANIIGLANTPSDAIALINADATWNTHGLALNAGNCKIAFVPTTPGSSIHNVYVAPQTGSGSGGSPLYAINVQDYCIGGDKPLSSFPQNMYVQYTTNGTLWYIGDATSYADMMTKLAAETHKPANITYTSVSNTNPAKIQIQVNDSNPSLMKYVSVYGDKTDLVLIGSNSHFGNPTAGVDNLSEIYPDSNSIIGNICGNAYPGGLHQNAWHVIRVINRLYYLDSIGHIVAYDITDPLHPVILGGIPLFGLVPGAPHTPFSGIPAYAGGLRSDWDCYFVTDPNAQTQGDYLYVVESTSGTIYKIDPSSLSVVGAFYSANMLGMCPRVIYNNKLYLTRDGNRGTSTGVISANPNAANKLVILDLNVFSVSGFSAVTIDPAGVTGEVWAMSSDPKAPGTAYITTLLGNVFTYNMNTDTVTNTYNGLINDPNINTATLINTAVAANRLYISAFGVGSYQLAINTFGSASANPFQPLTAGNLIGANNKKHYNFLVLPNSCFGVLTFDNGGNDAGIARYDLDGNLLFVETFAGSIYNLVYQSGITSPTPNSLCP